MPFVCGGGEGHDGAVRWVPCENAARTDARESVVVVAVPLPLGDD